MDLSVPKLSVLILLPSLKEFSPACDLAAGWPRRRAEEKLGKLLSCKALILQCNDHCTNMLGGLLVPPLSGVGVCKPAAAAARRGEGRRGSAVLGEGLLLAGGGDGQGTVAGLPSAPS